MAPPPPRAPAPPRERQSGEQGERFELLKMLRIAERAVAHAEGAVAAAVRARDRAKAAWEYAREHYSNPHRSAQIPDDRWAAWNQQEKAALDAARLHCLAAARATGEPEEALFWAKHEAKEARFELDEFEKAQRRQGRRRAQEAEDAEKWVQIKEMIEENHTLHVPNNPDYWEPDAWEYEQLHRLWKLQ